MLVTVAESISLLDEGALGACDIGTALARAVSAGARRVIIIGDGNPTAGESDAAKLAAIVRGSTIVRVDAIQLGQAIDRDTLAPILRAGQRPGEIVPAGSGTALVRRLSTELAADVAVRVDGATEVWPATTHAIAPGDPVWVFGRRPAGTAGAPLVVHLGGRIATVVPVIAEDKRIARAVAGAELAALTERMTSANADDRRALGDKIETLALANDLISARTSLIVLETDFDERMFLDGKPPTVDPTSTTQGITIDRNYLENIPVPGRTFESALGAAAGSQGDDMGVSFSGSTNLENQYYVDGINTTGLTYGTVGSPVMPFGSPYGIGAGDGGGGCCGGGPSEPEYARPYRPRTAEIMTAIRRRDTSRALALATAWQLETPGDVAAILALGEALEARGATVAAARAYGSLVDLFPNRAEMLRAAGERLDRVPGARALAIDAYRRAIRERPDQVSTYRLLAYDLMLDNDPTALDVLFDGMKHASRGSVQDILTDDNHDIAAYLLVHAPAASDYVRARVRGTLLHRPVMRIVLSWETDANDVDLHVRDARGGHAWFQDRELPSGGHLLDDLTDGYGPEMFEADSPAAFPYRIAVHYYNRGPEGVGLGSVQIIRSDGAGNVSVETRPFVLENDNAMIELGTIPR